jgi:RND superfamily putative drug exporter
MKRPVAIVLACLVVLGIFAAPLKDIAFSQVDSRALPATNPAAMADAQSLARFSSQEASPIHLIIPHASANAALIPGYLAAVAKISNVVGVGKESTANDFLSVDLYDKVGARTNAAQSMITAIRAVKAPAGTLVGGAAADYTDTQEGIAHTMPLAFGWIALSVLILLFLFTGSIILPIKAVLLNVVSLSASLGLVTWIFIDGHLTWLVGKFTNVGSLDTGMVILTAVVTFALSMDYEVFLLSRIKEEHDGGHSNIESVATGLQRSARIITAAALLLAVVFAAFITSGVTSIKILGLGVAFAVLVDATIVRALLVPALMRLFGDLNWWAPKALKRFSIKH